MSKVNWMVCLVAALVLVTVGPVWASGDHEHATGESGMMQLISWLGAFHPAVVHFPIALLLVALPAELIAVMFRSEKFAAAGRYCLVLGALSAVVAATLGWCMGGFKLTDGGWGMMTQHRWAGTIVALLAVWLLILCPLSARPGARVARRLYLMSLVVTAGLVGVTGFLGGALVWGTDHLSW